jgi:hypothetical protein
MRNLFRAAALAALLSSAARADWHYAWKPSVTVSVGTSATLCAPTTGHTFIEVWNTDASKYLEVSFDSTLTYGKGRPVLPGQFIHFTQLTPGQRLYCVTSSGTLDARVQEGFEQ